MKGLDGMIKAMICSKLLEKKADIEARITAEKNKSRKFYYLQVLETLNRMLEEYKCEVKE